MSASDRERALRANIRAFYGASNASERDDAETWLLEFSKASDSWNAALNVLEGDDASEAESVFCARTLHVLLRRCVAKEERKQPSHVTLSSDEWWTLRERLFELMRTYSIRATSKMQNARTTLTQLALATSALACKMPTWEPKDVVRDSISKISGDDASASAESKVLCLCAFLAFLAQEANSRELSIHPARREHVLAGLKGASKEVMGVLECLALSSSGVDAALLAYIFDALSSWAEFSDITQAFPSFIVDGAVQILCGQGLASSHLRQSATNAARTALVQCIRAQELHGFLSKHLRTLRAHVILCDQSEESRALMTEILSAVAMGAVREREPVANPFATGPQAAGDRVYVKYVKFKDLKREQKKADKKKASESMRADVDIVEEVLTFALDGLNEALAFGVSFGSALEPWSRLVDVHSGISPSVCASLRAVAGRCIEASVMHASSLDLSELEDQYKEEIGDCLRDVTTIVPIDEALYEFMEGFKFEIQTAVRENIVNWRIVRARLVILLALAKSFKTETKKVERPSFGTLVDVLCNLLTAREDVGVPCIILESTAWVLGGLASSFSYLSDARLVNVANVLISRLRHREPLIARGASVALMKMCEYASERLARTDVPARLAALHADGGPTPSRDLRLGQEHESTIMLRSLTFFIVQGDADTTERACLMLVEPVILSMRACMDSVEHNMATYVRCLVDLDICLQAVKRAYEYINKVSPTLDSLALSAAHVIAQASVSIIAPEDVEQRFKIGWVMRALLELVRHVGHSLLQPIVRICVEAYALEPSLGSCYLETLNGVLATYGDCESNFRIQGAEFSSVGQVVAELIATILPDCFDNCERWPAIFNLARGCLRCGCVSLIPHVPLLVRCCEHSLKIGVSDDPAAAALLFATDILCAPLLLTSVPQNSCSTAMHAGLGRIAAEFSGQLMSKRNGCCAWNVSGAASVTLAAAIEAEGRSVAVVRLLLEASNGNWAPAIISDIAAVLHFVWTTYGDQRFSAVLIASLGGDDDGFPKIKTSRADKMAWVNQLLCDDARVDVRVFKRSLKAFLGGKKVGTN